MNKIKIAVIGYGHLGKWHCQKVESLKESADLVAIVEKFPENQNAAKKSHPLVKVVSDIKEIVNDIDAAFVVTPTSTHFELVKFLLENNRHVFCEKPLCSNDGEGILLRQLIQDKNLVLQVGHSERFHQAWEMLRGRFQQLKPPFIVRINRIAPFKGRATDVDVIQDLAIHDLDLVLYLFKQKPKRVFGKGLKIRTSNWDHASIRLELENNCDAHIVVSRNSVKEVRDLEVISQDGMITVDLFANKIYEASNSSFDDGSFVREENYIKRDHLLLEHSHFYQSIMNHDQVIVNLNDGLNAVHLVDCSLKSIEDNIPVVVNFG